MTKTTETPRQPASGQPELGQHSLIRRLAPLAVIAVLAGIVIAMGWHRELTLENLVRHRAALSGLVQAHGVTAIAAFILLYVAVVALSLPGASILTVAGGALFGVWSGGSSAIVGATLGAAIIFLIARSALGEVLARRAGPKLARLAEGFRKDAVSYMLFLRLVPVFPFFLVNLASAIFGARLLPFVLTTAIGIIPGTFAFALVGAGLDSAIKAQEQAFKACEAAGRADCKLNFDIQSALTPTLLAALAALGFIALIPVVVTRLRERRRNR